MSEAFIIVDRDGYSYVAVLEKSSIPSETHIKIKKRTTNDIKFVKEYSFENGFNDLKVKILSDNRKVWDEAVFNSLEILDKNQQCSPELKLHFLRDVIFILCETGIVYSRKPHLLKDLTYLYYTVSKRSTSPDVSSYLSIEACERYLELLADDAGQEWFDRMALNKKPEITREKEVEDVVTCLNELIKSNKGTKCPLGLKCPLDKGALVSSEQQKKINQALNRSKDMLLAWYNLKKAVEIATTLQGGWGPKRLRRFISGWLPDITGFVTIAYCVWFKAQTTAKYVFNPLKFVGADPIIFSIYVLMIFGIGNSLWKLSQKTKEINLQIYLPRIPAGIIVGYLVLMSDEAWGGIFGVHGSLFIGRTALPCMAVILYIFIEMNNVKGIRYPIYRKAIRLFSRGAAYAVLTGVLISDLFGDAIVNRIYTDNGNTPPAIKGLFGHIYPEVIFYLAPLALFIGVFLQLLWEDKPLTAKI